MRSELQNTPGVLAVETDLGSRTATVTFDDKKTSPDALAKRLTDYVGQHDFTAKVK